MATFVAERLRDGAGRTTPDFPNAVNLVDFATARIGFGFRESPRSLFSGYPPNGGTVKGR